MDISETEFFSLKSEQSLLVDFQAFPAKLIEILELCMNVATSKGEKINFACVLETRSTGEAFLNVVENNQFKALCHLSLRFREATDQILKQHLASRLSSERSANEDLRIKNERLEEALMKRSEDFERATSELKHFQEERDRKIDHLLLEKQREINQLREDSLGKETTAARDYDKERRSLVEQYEREIRELQQKLETANENLKIQTEKRYCSPLTTNSLPLT